MWSHHHPAGATRASRRNPEPSGPGARGRVQAMPALLPLDGDGSTFTALLRLCGASDVRATTLLKELRAAGAIRETPDGRLEALKRVYIPQTMDEQLIRLWGTVIADVASTYGHNLMRRADVAPRFQRAALNDRVLATALPEFQKFLNRDGQAFLDRVDA